MTSDRHVATSDRGAEAAESLDCTHVVNVQGDEILVLPEDLEQMITAIGTNIGEQFWNATGNIRTASDLGDESIVKCVVSRSGRILFCSRDFSHLPLNGHFEPLRMILGILGYTRDSLLNYNKLPRTPLEEMLSIDQSRIIENDIPLLAVSFSKGYIGINNRREETQVRGILAKDERQRSVLEDVLNF